MKISDLKFVTLFLMGFFSLFLLANDVNLLRINSYNDENTFSIDTINIENAYALEIDNITNTKKGFNHDTLEDDKSITLDSFVEESRLEKDSNKEIQYQKGEEIEFGLKNNTSQNTTLTTTKSSKSIERGFNFAAAGDWSCTSKTKDTVKNIIAQNPEVVLALGDLSYDNRAKCWLNIIKPVAEKTKIAIGNHEVESSKKLKDYMKAFNLEKQYYSFNYQNVHFLALSTETSYDQGSKQYKFAQKDLEQYSNDKTIEWIVVFYHKQAYSSGGGQPDEKDFRESYHPLFDKYNVDLALQGHHHAYERFYPITFNDKNDNKPIVSVKDKVKGSNVFQNPDGTIFITVGTGGAESMTVSKGKSFSAAKEDGKFGILNVSLKKDEKNNNKLIGTFVHNKKNHKILDEFEIIKNSK
jgi:hypothetical protein